MNYRDIDLNLDYKKCGAAQDGYQAHLTEYVPKQRGNFEKTAVLILPGGAYYFTSENEGEPVAVKFASEGMPSFVLWYSVVPNRFPCAILETLAAVKYIRTTYPEIEKVFLCGFSAGGHLAGLYSSMYEKYAHEYLHESGDNYRVDGSILAYPVVSSDPAYLHSDTFNHLLGDRVEEKKASLSLENLICEKTPRAFLWATCADSCVPATNCLLYASCLAKFGIPYEVHVYQDMEHGLSMANAVCGKPECRHSDWFNQCIRWMQL